MSTLSHIHLPWLRFGQQLRHPTGWAGRLTGHLMAALNREPYQRALKALAVQPGDQVLELGFGAGQGLAKLCGMTKGGHVYGVDHSAAMIDMAQRRNADLVARGQLHLHCGGFSPLPFPSSFFDRLLLVNVLYFFDRSGEDLAECRRVLKSGGRVALYLTGRSTMQEWPFCEPETHRMFDAEEVRSVLSDSGFAVTDVITLRLPFRIEGILVTATC